MRLALYQCPPQPLDVEANLQRLEHQVRRAAEQQVQLLVCPEMFLTGYNIGAPAATRLAQPCDGPAAQRVGELARTHGLAILYGYPERADDGQVYNAVQLIDRHGQRLCNYRKTHLFGELDRAMFSAGQAPSAVVELDGWQVAMLICYDLEFPENARQLALAGAELILVPTANMLPFQFIGDVTVRSRAFENQCYVAYANYCGAEGQIEYFGQSSVAGADGQRVAGAQTSETLLLADLQRNELQASRQLNRYLMDRRPELYALGDKK